MFIFLVFSKSHITMLDVEALERLRDEVMIKESQLQRLLISYSPLDIVLKRAAYCDDVSGEKKREDLEWYRKLSKWRRKRIKARQAILENWHLELRDLDHWLCERIKMRRTWALLIEATLSNDLQENEDVVKIIWDKVWPQQKPTSNAILDALHENRLPDVQKHCATISKDLQNWHLHFLVNMPTYEVEPPCNYERRRKRWKVRCKWHHLIVYFNVNQAAEDKKNSVHNDMQGRLCNSYLRWASAYLPMRLEI
jgi:hypothetical protein